MIGLGLEFKTVEVDSLYDNPMEVSERVSRGDVLKFGSHLPVMVLATDEKGYSIIGVQRVKGCNGEEPILEGMEPLPKTEDSFMLLGYNGGWVGSSNWPHVEEGNPQYNLVKSLMEERRL